MILKQRQVYRGEEHEVGHVLLMALMHPYIKECILDKHYNTVSITHCHLVEGIRCALRQVLPLRLAAPASALSQAGVIGHDYQEQPRILRPACHACSSWAETRLRRYVRVQLTRGVSRRGGYDAPKARLPLNSIFLNKKKSSNSIPSTLFPSDRRGHQVPTAGYRNSPRGHRFA